MVTAALWPVLCVIILYYSVTHTILYNRSDFAPLFAKSSLDHSENRNDQCRSVKQEFKNEVIKLLRFGLHYNLFFLSFVKWDNF